MKCKSPTGGFALGVLLFSSSFTALAATHTLILDAENQAVVISGNNAVRLFRVATNVSFEVKNLMLANGRHIGTNGADADPVAGQPAQPGEDGAGGAIYNDGGTIRLVSCVLSNNSAVAGRDGLYNQPNSTPAAVGIGRGGAVFNQSGNVLFENVIAISNSIIGGLRRSGMQDVSNGPSLGGAVSSIGGSLSITNSSFISNVATGRLTASVSIPSAPARGGAMYTENALVIVHGGSFSENVAVAQSAGSEPMRNAGSAYGGALFFHSSTAVVERSRFWMNSALGGSGSSLFGGASGEGQAGAVYNNGVLHLLDTSVSANQALGGRYSNPSQSGQAGGLYNAGTAFVNRTTFDSNLAKGGAGGIRFNPTTGGDGRGGAIVNLGTLYGTNCTLALNRAQAGGTLFQSSQPIAFGGTASGGGIQNDGGTLHLMNVTVASNIVVQGQHSYASQGANLANATGTLSLRNSLIAFGLGFSNEVATGVYSNASGTITDDGFNMSSDGSCNFSSGSSFNFTDPKLDGLADNSGPTLTMALLPGSPAIDFGTAIGAPPTDQRGFRRPSGAGVDIGAFEAGAPTSELELAATRNGSMLNISFTVETGRTYELQRSTDLASWQVHEVITPSSSGSISRNIPMAESHSFFRVKTQ